MTTRNNPHGPGGVSPLLCRVLVVIMAVSVGCVPAKKPSDDSNTTGDSNSTTGTAALPTDVSQESAITQADLRFTAANAKRAIDPVIAVDPQDWLYWRGPTYQRSVKRDRAG